MLNEDCVLKRNIAVQPMKNYQYDVIRTNFKKFCPTVIGKYFWNNIPLSIRSKSPKKSLPKVSSAFFSRTVSVLAVVFFV